MPATAYSHKTANASIHQEIIGRYSLWSKLLNGGKETPEQREHVHVSDAIDGRLYELNIPISDEHHSLRGNDAVWYGVYDIHPPHLLYWHRRNLSCRPILGVKNNAHESARFQLYPGLRLSSAALCLTGRQIDCDKEKVKTLQAWYDKAAYVCVRTCIDELRDFEHVMQRLEGEILTDAAARDIIYDVVQQRIITVHLFHEVHQNFFGRNQERTKWQLVVAFADATNLLLPVSKFNTAHRLGMYFFGEPGL